MGRCIIFPQVLGLTGRHIHCIAGFIAALEPKLNKMVVRKYADTRDKPNTLEAIFQMAE